MKRLLLFSMEHQRPIRIFWQDDEGELRQRTAVVSKMTDDGFTFRSIRPHTEMYLSYDSLLSVDFRRGDDGQVEK